MNQNLLHLLLQSAACPPSGIAQPRPVGKFSAPLTACAKSLADRSIDKLPPYPHSWSLFEGRTFNSFRRYCYFSDLALNQPNYLRGLSSRSDERRSEFRKLPQQFIQRHQVQHSSQIVNQRTQRELRTDFLQAAHQKGIVSPLAQCTKHVLDYFFTSGH